MIAWSFRSFQDLSKDDLYAILSLRQDVFIIEQQSIYRDLDFLDQKATHLMGMMDDKLAAYMRLLPPGTVYPDSFCVGRFVTAPFARQQGLGKAAIEQARDYFKKIDSNTPIRGSAQLYLVKWYESLGFQTEGQPYDDGGVPHIDVVCRNC